MAPWCAVRRRLRESAGSDAEQIAALHADSCRRHYRGAYSDAFLDGDVDAGRQAVWNQRLREGDGGAATIMAEDGVSLVGFVHVIFDDDPNWGCRMTATKDGRSEPPKPAPYEVLWSG